jgi:hypothetical protein
MGSDDRVYADWDPRRVAWETTPSDSDTDAQLADVVLDVTRLRFTVHLE